MNSKVIKVDNEKSFLQVDIEPFTQKGKTFYLGKVKADNILDLFTVRPAEYDLRKHIAFSQIYEGESDYYSYLINEDKNNIANKDFQRDADGARLNEVATFLNEEEYAFFPNTVIVTCDLINDFETFNITVDNSLEEFLDIKDRPENFSFLSQKSEKYSIFIPYIKNSILVIDGQHRLRGLEKSNPEVIANYDLIIAFIIGYDRSVIAKQFYTVNFYQKPVNKSLLYQLTGEFTREVDELTFLHYVVKILNELDNSPFAGRIKMLGKNPKDATPDEKLKLSVSQAFLVDSLMSLISQKNTSSIYIPVFLPFYLDANLQSEIIRILARYFNAVAKLRNDWNFPSQSILSKGMGIGALIKILNLVFPIIVKDKLSGNLSNVQNLKVADFVEYLQGIETVNLSEFSGVGSAGSITKIRNKLIENLKFNKYPTYDAFVSNLKLSYIPEYQRIINAALSNYKPTKTLIT